MSWGEWSDLKLMDILFDLYAIGAIISTYYRRMVYCIYSKSN